MSIQEQLESFYRFAVGQLKDGVSPLSMDELYDAWKCQQLSKDELSVSVAAVQSALNDMENGDTGRPLDEVIAEIRANSKVSREP